jgi:hypothetical protein
MSVPVRGSFMHSRSYLLPGIESPTLQRKGAQHLPPRLDQLQVRRIHRLEDELPPWVRGREEHRISRPMCLQVVHDCVYMLNVATNMEVHPTQKVDIAKQAVSRRS